MAFYHVPGVSSAIIENAKILKVQGFGFADAETKQTVTEKTVFQAASLTKPIFAYLVIKLARMGIIDLDVPLSDYFVEHALQNDPFLPRITARRVLCHTTGLPNWRGKNPLYIHFMPGERWGYSGEGYLFLQRVIEHQTSQCLQDLLSAHVFQPLGMTSSNMVWSSSFEETASAAHDEQGRSTKVKAFDKANAAFSLYTTPTDFGYFILETLRTAQEHNPILTPQIHVTDVAPWNEHWDSDTYKLVDNVAWGLGWGLQKHDDQWAFWHWGDNWGFKSFAIGFPHCGDGIIVMTNGEMGQLVYRLLVETILGQLQPSLDWLKHLYS